MIKILYAYLIFVVANVAFDLAFGLYYLATAAYGNGVLMICLAAYNAIWLGIGLGWLAEEKRRRLTAKSWDRYLEASTHGVKP